MVSHIPTKFGGHQYCGIEDVIVFLSRDLARRRDCMVMRLYGHGRCGNELVVVCHVISLDQVIK